MIEATKPKRRRGRPTREEASRKLLARLAVDPATIDPKAILAAIAADASAPAAARVTACRALLGMNRGSERGASTGTGDVAGELTARALSIMATRH